MFPKGSLLLLAAIVVVAFAAPASAGLNANAVVSLDLIADGGAGNGTDDGITSGTVSGQGTTIAIEIFATGVRTSLIGVTLEFDFDASLLSFVEAKNSVFPFTLPEGSTGTYFVVMRNPVTLASSGFLARAEFATVSDVTGREFSIGIESVSLAESTTSSDELTTTSVITFNASPSPDFDGDNWVGFTDFLIFGQVFGSQQGDGTYDARMDLNSDGSIGFTDFLIFGQSFGGPPPSTGGGDGGNPDLVVQSPSVSSARVAARGPFALSATVRNLGSAASAATTLRYYRSTDATVSTSNTQVGTDAVRGLSASGASAESIDLTAPAGSGTYYYGACVDAVAGESDTRNNCSASVTVTVTTQTPPATGASKLYWTDWGTNKIQRANLDGSGVEDLVSGAGLDGPDGLALDMAGGKMYWTDTGVNKIQRADLNGSNVEDLVTGLGIPYGLALDMAGGKMYWTNRQTSKIQRADLSGANVEDLVTSGLTFPGGLALDASGGKMYWTNPGMSKIQRANLDGSGVEDLVTSGVSSPTGIALDVSGGKMYWTDRHTDKIQRSNLNGSGVEDLVTTGLNSPNGLALDVSGGKMYWADAGTNKVQRANLDGSGVEDLVTRADGLVDPSGVAVGTAPGNGGSGSGGSGGGGGTAQTRTAFESSTPSGYERITLSDNGTIWGVPTKYTTDSDVGTVAYVLLGSLKECAFANAEADRQSKVYIKTQSLGRLSNFESATVCRTASRAWASSWNGVRITHLRFFDESSPTNVKEAVYNASTGQMELDGVSGGGNGGGGASADLVVETPSVSSSRPVSGASFTLSATVRNTGTGSSAATTLRYYRSSNATISTSDTAVGTDAVSGLAASGASAESIRLTAPSGTGTYYYGACVDAVSGESDTGNNCSAAVTVTVGAAPAADLVVVSPSVDNNSPAAGASFTLSATVRNGGNGPSAASTLRYYRSSNTTISAGDTEVGTDAVSGLAASGASAESIDLTAPSNPGTYYYGACVDAVSGESDTGNNCSAAVTVTVGAAPAADLVVVSPSVDNNSPAAGASFTLSATVRNGGNGSSAASTLRYYRSSDATISASDTEVGTDAVSGLAASGASAESIDLTAPSGTGTYYYGACVDAVSGESDTGNNCSAAVTVTVGAAPAPDLVVVSPSVDNNSPAAGASFTLSATVRNGGNGPSAASTLRYYRSSDATISAGDTEVGTDAVSGLAASGASAESIDLTAPSGTGTYYYGACVDAVSGESDTGNNCSAAVSVTVASQPPPPTVASKLYWTDWGTDKIQRGDLDGSNVEDLVSSAGLDGPDGLALDMAGGKMYWTDAGTAKIQRADLDGSNVENLITSGLSIPYGLALDVSGGKMYWTDRPNGKIQRADLDGSNVEDLLTLAGFAFPGEIALDVANGKMYWTSPGSDKIQRADLDGTGLEDLVTSGLSGPIGLALDLSGGKMYWTDRGTHKIQRAGLDGSNVEDLVASGLTSPNGLDLDVSGGKMYWTDIDADKVQRADLDGSNVEDLLTSTDGLVDPSGVAVAVATVSAGGGSSSQTCAVGGKLNPGDTCSGSGYSLRNDSGVLVVDGNIGGITLGNTRFNANTVNLNNLRLTRSGNVWTIVSLP